MEVLLCCFLELGDMRESDVSEIWNKEPCLGPKLLELRGSIR